MAEPQELEQLRYPIGRFAPRERYGEDEIREAIDAIASAPSAFRAAVEGLSDEQLDTPYRPGGWTIRQLVHHVPDSHLNAYIRFRLALTEDAPTIKTYDEKLWSELADARSAPIGPSLDLLEALHDRWVRLLRSLGPEDFDRPLVHPEWGTLTLAQLLALYAWHGRHHAAHATAGRGREGW